MLERAILHRNLECSVHESRQIEVVKQEMTRMNINILEISKLRWTGMSEFNSDDHYKKKQYQWIYKTERDSKTWKMNLWLPGGRNSKGVWEGHVHTAIFKTDNKQRPIV